MHISIFRDFTRITEFKKFCNETVDAIKPLVVLASGDLTDAKTKDKMGSTQVLEEWKYYKQIIDETNVSRKTLWLDVRGNHDNFNILNLQSDNNYYKNYSIQGKKYPKSYKYELSAGSELYTFIAVDACLQPGPKRPFNFIGVLDEYEIRKLQDFMDQSLKSKTDYIFWFGHYPTSCILSTTESIRKIIGKYKKSMVYLCGHYHTLGGTVPNMYTLQQAGFLELELADWKDNRMYRLAVIDHGQFSFIDIKHQDWPIALITNPKHALYMMPQRENIQSIIKSTHIRVLAFSTKQIKSVKAQLNNNGWIECKHIKGPLYVVPWNSSLYLTGIHTISVQVIDDGSRSKVISQPFSLDGTRLSFRVLPRFLLMSNAVTVFQFLFASVLVLLIAPLCIFRILHILCEGKRINRPKIRMKFLKCIIRKLWVLATIDRLFFPIILYALYLTIGPWTIGEVIENHIGVIFAWGTFVGNSYLPGGFTYVYGFFQLFSFHLPLTIILSHHADKRLQRILKTERRAPSRLCLFWQHLPILLLLVMQIIMAYFFWLAYGTLAIILCPLRTWSIVLAIILWYQVHTMPQTCFRSASAIWSTSR
ncbi:transmembrane protein 62-like isoform X2 [Prorops nasuta]